MSHSTSLPFHGTVSCDHLSQQNTPALLAPPVEKSEQVTQSLVSLLSLQGIHHCVSMSILCLTCYYQQML